MKKTRRSKAKNSKGVYILAFAFILLGLLAAIMIFSTSNSNNNNTTNKVKAGEYLHITHTKSMGEFLYGGKAVMITELGLNITAVMGDAHSIVVQVDGQADPSADVYKFIGKGETLSISVKLKPTTIELNAEGKFSIEVDISCSEALHDQIPLLIDPTEIIAPSK